MMRVVPANLQAHLNSGTTTLSMCWRLKLRSGETLGFTDHDQPLSFLGTEFEADSGFTASEIEAAVGFGVDNLEASGALQSGKLDEQRLRAGDFDHAEIEIWKVNWSDVSQRLLMRTGHLGEVTSGSGKFQAEVRGLTHALNQTRGRIYQYGCDAKLGDARCGQNLNAVAYRDQGIVTAIDGATLKVSGINFASGWLNRGEIKWITGAGAGRTLAIQRHRKSGGTTEIVLRDAPSFICLPGEQVEVTAGCDKAFETCRSKFSNQHNFRGFPHMPGTEFVAGFPKSGDPKNNGAKRH
jgi:uncharacterized phage protein (TIGR02218 family)